jgi:ABC-type molybdate transport system substrate-binding protein
VVPAERGPAIRYPAAVLRAASEPERAAALIAELLSANAQRRFAERGFGPPREESP